MLKRYEMMTKYVFLICVSFSFICSANSQINIKIGYNFNNFGFELLNDILIKYDTQNGHWLDTKLSSINYSHGFEFGLRMNVNTSSFEIGVTNNSTIASAYGIRNETRQDVKLKMRMLDYHINYIQKFGAIGIGVGGGRQTVSSKIYDQVLDEYLPIYKEKNWIGRLFISLEIPSNSVSLSIRPYFLFSFDKYDFSEIASTLDVENPMDSKLKTFGIAVHFFNGAK